MKYTFRFKEVLKDGSHHFSNMSFSRFEDSFWSAYTLALAEDVASVDIYYMDRKMATFY